MSHIRKICGVYLIRNLTNGKFYIGSSVNIRHRWAMHKVIAKRPKYPVHLAMKKYGLQNFELEILIESSEERIRQIEQNLLNRFINTDQCYNIATDTTAPFSGRRHSTETRKTQSIKTRTFLETHTHSMKGRTHSLETRKLMSIASMGKNKTPQHANNISMGLTGIRRTNQTKLKIRNIRRPQGYPTLTNSDGEVYSITGSLVEFCKIHNLVDRHLSRVINGHRKSYKGWRLYGGNTE